jgi:hypothetical protein
VRTPSRPHRHLDSNHRAELVAFSTHQFTVLPGARRALSGSTARAFFRPRRHHRRSRRPQDHLCRYPNRVFAHDALSRCNELFGDDPSLAPVDRLSTHRLFCFAISRSFPLSLTVLFIAGGFQTTFLSAIATLLQIHSDESNRGRMMSLFGLINRGLGPMGSFPLRPDRHGDRRVGNGRGLWDVNRRVGWLRRRVPIASGRRQAYRGVVIEWNGAKSIY